VKLNRSEFDSLESSQKYFVYDLCYFQMCNYGTIISRLLNWDPEEVTSFDHVHDIIENHLKQSSLFETDQEELL